jgi:hypothetical protein
MFFQNTATNHWRTLWLIFSIKQLRHGTMPIRDPYGHPGRSFIGEMQTSGFPPFSRMCA